MKHVGAPPSVYRGELYRRLLVLASAAALAVLVLPKAHGAEPSEPAGNQARPGTHVLIVSGINKDPEEAQDKARTATLLRRLLIDDFGLSQDMITLLADEDSFVQDASGRSSLGSVQEALKSLASRVKREDLFVFYYVGQANVVADTLRLNVRGEDITHTQLASWLLGIPAERQLLILDCPGAGLAIKALSKPGAVIICGARSDQPYSTRFSRFFVPALADSAADSDGDGRVSLLEAFQYAAAGLDKVYRDQDLLKTETSLLEDDGDGVPSQQPWRYEEEGKDGRVAARFFLGETTREPAEK